MTYENKKGRVIITHGRGLMSLVIAHSLSKQGLEIYGCDSVDYTLLSFSKSVKEYFLCPDFRKDEEAYIDFMIEKVKAIKPDDERPYVLMPSFKETKLFSKYRRRFEPYIKIAAPDYEAINKIHPKNHLAETIKKYEINAPRTWLPDNEEELEKIAENEISFPILIKPYNQSSGHGIHKVENKKQLVRYWRDNEKKYQQKSLLQEIMQGKEYCYCALYDSGEKRVSMTYENLYTFPPDSGPGAMRQTVKNDQFAKVADPLMQKLNWNGVAEFDFFWDGDEQNIPALIEVNSRFWGGLFHSVEAGIDFPWLLYKLFVEGTVTSEENAVSGTKTKLPGTWIISALQEIVTNDEHSEEIEKKGREALLSIKDGEILEGIKIFGSYIKDHIDTKEKQIKYLAELARSARGQVLDTDDPQVIWGFLFIFSSLLRHGEFPKEVSF